MTFQERIEEFPIELFGADVWSAGAPPFRRRFAAMKSDATEQPGVAKNERALRLMQHKVIVLLRLKTSGLDTQLARHPEMNSDPIAAGEFEEHLFSQRLGPEKA